MNPFAMERIDLKDYMVVKKDFFSKERVPVLTLGPKFFCVNAECHLLLDRCEAVQFRISKSQKGVIITPISSSDDSGVVWRNSSKHSMISKLHCPQLAMQLYREWQLNPEHTYRLKGTLICPDKKVMLIFNLHGADIYEGNRKAGIYD